MKEFQVRVQSFRGYAVVEREEALYTAKQMILGLIEDGFRGKQLMISFYNNATREHLGSLKLIKGTDMLDCSKVDDRLMTLKAILKNN